MITMNKLLTRDEFREGVFKRDNHRCVVCGEDAVDAHHIIERRCFTDGGYYLNNGASVCEKHHLECEMTLISVEQLRDYIGISNKDKVIPDHFYDDEVYDKWGNIILQNGKRLKGELFHDESVQKILAKGNVLGDFTDYVKYQRTYHCPWSQGITDDDRVQKDMKRFEGQRVIVTEKMDGESFSGYNDYCHARSVDSRNHESRNWAKTFWAKRQYLLDKGWRICAENVFAKHAIAYDNLDSYLYGFSIWNDKNICLSWDETLEWFELLDMRHVPVLYDGIYDEALIKALYNEKTDWNTREGYVIRLASSFSYSDFKNCIAKYVRKNHVESGSHHWMHKKIEPNKLKDSANEYRH